MAPSTWAVASSAVDLSKHLGHKVTVTGSPAQGKMDARARVLRRTRDMAEDGCGLVPVDRTRRPSGNAQCRWEIRHGEGGAVGST
jgi:hypothetical protein